MSYFHIEKFSDSDVEGERIVESSCALLTGRSGCGKTAAVYALAEELGLHVLEVNASTCRTGKQVGDLLFLIFLLFFLLQSVLRIQLILMRIRILDPHWKKMDPDVNVNDF